MNQHFKIRDRRGDNRYFVDNAFLKNWGAKLGPHCIATYNVLVMYANADDQTAYPSFQTIADLTGMSRRQAVREIEKLKTNNIIRVDERTEVNSESGKPHYLTNIFTLLHPDEWGELDKCLHEPSDSESLPLVTGSQQPSDSLSPPLVTQSHLNNTHKQNPINNTQRASHSKPEPIPAVKVHVEVTGKYSLNKAQIKEIAEVVGDTPIALEKWRSVVKAWVMRDYKPSRIDGMLEWFKNGIPIYQKHENGFKNGSHPPANKSSPPLNKTRLEELQAESAKEIYDPLKGT